MPAIARRRPVTRGGMAGVGPRGGAAGHENEPDTPRAVIRSCGHPAAASPDSLAGTLRSSTTCQNVMERAVGPAPGAASGGVHSERRSLRVNRQPPVWACRPPVRACRDPVPEQALPGQEGSTLTRPPTMAAMPPAGGSPGAQMGRGPPDQPPVFAPSELSRSSPPPRSSLPQARPSADVHLRRHHRPPGGRTAGCPTRR